MPIIPNTIQSSIELNNSFSTIPSGSANGFLYRIEEGRLFSSSGFVDKTYVYKKPLETKEGDSLTETSYLKVILNPASLFATGVSSITQDGGVLSALQNENEVIFYTKAFSKTEKENWIDGDLVFLKTSGQQNSSYNIFEGFLEKDEEDNFIFQLCLKSNGGYPLYKDDGSEVLDQTKSVKINFGKESGQKIFCFRGVYDNGVTKFYKDEPLKSDFNFLDEGEDFASRSSNGLLQVSSTFSVLLPAFLIDFDRSSLVKLKDTTITFSTDSSCMGINNKFFASYG